MMKNYFGDPLYLGCISPKHIEIFHTLLLVELFIHNASLTRATNIFWALQTIVMTFINETKK